MSARPLAAWTTTLLLAGMSLIGVADAGVAAESRTAPGPALREDPATLRAALECTSDVGTSSKRTVLLVHGTMASSTEDWGGNLALELPKQGYPVCMVTIPSRALNDMQTNVEYVVSALRKLNQRSGKKVVAIGHSQGAFLISYALRYWPDLATKVSDVIGYAGTYTYGTDFAEPLCKVVCTEAFQQFRPTSNLLAAIAARPLPSGPGYTAYSTSLDEVVVPQPKASTLRAPGVRNYRLQDLCPTDVAEHLLLPFERPLLALTLDAMTHAGPARIERIDQLRCGLLPSAPATVPSLVTFALQGLVTVAQSPATKEPALRCYLRPDC
jgi:triacylglycerol lipase